MHVCGFSPVGSLPSRTTHGITYAFIRMSTNLIPEPLLRIPVEKRRNGLANTTQSSPLPSLLYSRHSRCLGFMSAQRNRWHALHSECDGQTTADPDHPVMNTEAFSPPLFAGIRVLETPRSDRFLDASGRCVNSFCIESFACPSLRTSGRLIDRSAHTVRSVYRHMLGPVFS